MFEQHAAEVDLPMDLRQAVENELDRDERLNWAAQPIPGRLALKALPFVLFGIPWTAITVVMIVIVSVAGGTGPGEPPLLLVLFFVPFVLIGLGMLSSPYWAYRKAGRSAYAITDRRAILLDAGWFGSLNVRSFGPDELDDLTRSQRADGSGDLVFAREYTHHTSQSGRTRTSVRNIGFLAVRNVKDVETILRTLAETAGTPREEAS